MEDNNNKEIPLIINTKQKLIDFYIAQSLNMENEKKSLVSILNSINSKKEINQGLIYALTTGEW